MSRNTRGTKRKLVIPQSNDLDGERIENETDKGRRILDLTSIKDVDKGVPDYAYWIENFKIIDDALQVQYNRIVSQYEEILPPTFFNGVASLEPIEPIILKKHIKFKELQSGKYHSPTSKSDAKVASNIRTMVNHLPSFERWKGKSDFFLDWVIKEQRLLLTELLEYHYGEKNRLPTIKTWINSMMRVMGICLTKQHPLYEKYATVMKSLKDWVTFSEGDNFLQEHEMHKYIDWDYVLLLQKKLQYDFDVMVDKKTPEAFALNQDLLLLSLYCLIPPLRAEIKTLKFTKTRQDKGDWIYFYNNDIVLELNEVKKKHDYIRVDWLPDELKAIIRQSYELYKRVPVFVDKNKYPTEMKQVSVKSLDERLANMFLRIFNKRVGSSSLRSSFVTYKERDNLTYNQRQKLSIQMRTSAQQMLLSYKKLDFGAAATNLDNPYGVLASVVPNITFPQPSNTSVNSGSAYQKQLENNKKYYNKHKDEILKQQKTYYESLDKKEQARKKILYFLNNDAEYHKKVRKSTMDKYKFKKEGSVWV